MALHYHSTLRRLVHENDLVFIVGGLADVLQEMLDRDDLEDINAHPNIRQAYVERTIDGLRGVERKMSRPIFGHRAR